MKRTFLIALLAALPAAGLPGRTTPQEKGHQAGGGFERARESARSLFGEHDSTDFAGRIDERRGNGMQAIEPRCLDMPWTIVMVPAAAGRGLALWHTCG